MDHLRGAESGEEWPGDFSYGEPAEQCSQFREFILRKKARI